jgi:hypothetical protein
MKANYTALLMALALAAPALNLAAQDQDAEQPRQPRPERFQQREGRDFEGPRDGGPRERGPRDDRDRPRGPRPDGQGPDGPRPPVPPLIGALDANHDGVIDDTEITNASAALKKLDKNNDGRLTMEELRPPRPLPPQDRNLGDRPNRPPQPRGERFRDGSGRPDGPPPGDAPRAPRRPRPPQDDQ